MITKQCKRFLNTPPLWDQVEFEIRQFDFPKIALDTFQAQAIPQNIRLGHQMEYVFKQLIEASDDYEIILYNLPISNDERTIGEIDFILKEQLSQKLIHVELSYKFYLIGLEITKPIHRLIGPNKNDLFFTKMEKIKNKQIPLLHSEEGVKALNTIGIDHQLLEHQCCFKAQLFQPYGHSKIDLTPLNNDCIIGYWLGMEHFFTTEFTSHQYYIPTKAEWAVEPNHQVDWRSHSEIVIHIKKWLKEKRSPMVWMKRTTGEYEKFFVVWWD